MKKELCLILFGLILFLLVSTVNAIENNYVCSDYPTTCEYANLTAALQGENNTANQIYLLENNTNYTLWDTTIFTFDGANILNLTGLFNVLIDCNQTWLNNTRSQLNALYTHMTINNGENITIRNCRFVMGRDNGGTGISTNTNIRTNITNNTFRHMEFALNMTRENYTYLSFNNFTNVYTFVYFKDRTADAFPLSSTENIVVEGNTGFNLRNKNGRHVFWLNGFSQNVTFKDNYLDNVSSQSIFVTRAWNSLLPTRVINNTVKNYNYDRDTVSDGAGIVLIFGNVEISNNTFINFSRAINGHGLGGPDGENITIIGNNFTDAINNTFYIWTPLRQKYKNITIKNNYFINNFYNYSLYLGKGNVEVEIINNTFINSGGIWANGSEYNIINNTFNETGNWTLNNKNVYSIYLASVNNTNITGNVFYNSNSTIKSIEASAKSRNTILWYNNFYDGGLNNSYNTTGCYSNIGNFYDYRISNNSMANGECGLINITTPISKISSNPVTISWTPQDSYNPISYTLEYIFNNVRTTIGTTTSTIYSWIPPSNETYLIDIIPNDDYTNGTHTNFTIAVLDFFPGDCNGDGFVGGPDYDAITAYISGFEVECGYYDETGDYHVWADNIRILDINKDDVADPNDADIMLEITGNNYNWDIINITSCQPWDSLMAEYRDPNGFFPSFYTGLNCN